jgi:hypothetical protein
MNNITTYKKIPSMTPECVHEYLTELGRQWTGQGVAIELGSWLGATAAALLTGLVEAGYDKPFYCCEAWTANEAQVKKAKRQGVTLVDKENILPKFINNIIPIHPNIQASRGNISSAIKNYPGEPIEICIFDAPKTNPTFTDAIQVLSPYWIPGHTVLGLLDYYQYEILTGRKRKKNLAPVQFMRKHAKSFTKIKEWKGKCSCVFFRYDKKLK